MADPVWKPIPREWSFLTYEDPETVLSAIRVQQHSGYFSSEQFKRLPSKERRQVRERRQAALLCCGLSQRFNCPVLFAMDESWNHDFISVICRPENKVGFVPVQLKEVVPVERNAKASLQAELEKLAEGRKYVDVLVAYHLNQDLSSFRPGGLRLPEGAAAEVWLFGAQGIDQRRWWLVGNLLGDKPRVTEFDHPEPPSSGAI